MKSLLHLGNCIVSGLVLIALAGLSLSACTTAATPAQTTVVVQTTPSSTPSPPPTPTPLPTAEPTDTPIMPTPSPTPAATSTLAPIAGFDISNLTYGVPLIELGKFTATFQLEVNTKENCPASETVFYLFEGDPQKGGTLIARQDIPELSGYDGSNFAEVLFSTAILWNVKGKAGDNELFSYLCPIGNDFSSDRCITHNLTKYIPHLNFDIGVTGERKFIPHPLRPGRGVYRFERGDVATIRAFTANLHPTDTLVFTMTTFINRPDVTSDITLAEERITLLPGELAEQTFAYDTTHAQAGVEWFILEIRGLPGVAQLHASVHIYMKEDAYFIAEPLSGTVPLSVTLIDRSSPAWGIEEWEWDFGDGSTSALSSPTHIYTQAGVYTVSLTTIVSRSTFFTARQYVASGYIPPSFFSGTTVLSITRPHYITASLPGAAP